ncbi:hypothetical protein GCM10023149_43860 [Mucilaginibacter gynuensis]|uniref:Outer membrane protein beta-barrel domain-containing protein n=1 Tax=Mucilaginibacter gynuensis TaxID=1302236 RepID=A0ABP8H844_9SPHI
MRIFYCAVLLLLPLFALSQANYHDGYVVKANGDTVKGYINAREWAHSPEVIEFKNSKSDKDALRFSAADISLFHITPYDTYVSYTGRISNNRNGFPNMDKRLDTTKTQATIFMKRVASGPNVTLYAQSDNVKTRYFYQEKSDVVTELAYYYYYNNSSVTTVVTKLYVGQLLLLHKKYNNDNNKNRSTIENSNFVESDLVKSINIINNSSSTTSNTQKGTEVVRPSNNRFFVGLGLTYTKTRFKGQNPFDGGDGGKTYTPKISIGYDAFANSQVQRVVFRGELSFNYISSKITSTQSATSGAVYSFNQGNFAFTPQLIFNLYNTDDLKLYVEGGAALTFSFFSNDKIVSGNSNITNQAKPYDVESFWLSYPFQIGAVINKKFDVSVGYTPSATYTRYTFFTLSNEVIGLNLKYLFNKK